MHLLRKVSILLILGGALPFFSQVAHGQHQQESKGFSIESVVSLAISNEEIVADRTETFLQYELRVPIHIRRRLTLSPSLFYLNGLAETIRVSETRQEPDGSPARVTGSSRAHHGLALGVRATHYFRDAKTGFFLSLGGFVMSNSAARNGFLFGVDAGYIFRLGPHWSAGLEGHLSSRVYEGQAWGLAGLGGIVRYNLAR